MRKLARKECRFMMGANLRSQPTPTGTWRLMRAAPPSLPLRRLPPPGRPAQESCTWTRTRLRSAAWSGSTSAPAGSATAPPPTSAGGTPAQPAPHHKDGWKQREREREKGSERGVAGSSTWTQSAITSAKRERDLAGYMPFRAGSTIFANKSMSCSCGAAHRTSDCSDLALELKHTKCLTCRRHHTKSSRSLSGGFTGLTCPAACGRSTTPASRLRSWRRRSSRCKSRTWPTRGHYTRRNPSSWSNSAHQVKSTQVKSL